MNEHLIKFIELCLVDGVISDKEREVIFRKSKELGVPEDECEIILQGMIGQKSERVLKIKNTSKNEGSFQDDMIEIDKLKFEKTPEDTLKSIFESSYLERIKQIGLEIEKINKDINKLEDEKNSLDYKLNNNDEEFNFLVQQKKDLVSDTEFDYPNFRVELKNYIIEKNSNKKKVETNIEQFDEYKLSLYGLETGFFGNKKKGEKFNYTWREFLERSDFVTEYFLNKNDLNLLSDIKNIYASYKAKVRERPDTYPDQLEKINILITANSNDNYELKHQITKINDLINNKNQEIKVLIQKIEGIKNIVKPSNFIFFKTLYNKSPVLFQSNIFSKYLQVIDVTNDKEIMNLTRFLKFITEKEREYSEEISVQFNKLERGELTQSDLNSLFLKRKNLTVFYNSFHLMYQGLVSGKMGSYMKVYIELETMGIFNTFFEKKVMNDLNMMNKHLEKLNSTLQNVCSEISRTNDYLDLLNSNMYELKLSVDETNYNLMDISSSIQEGNNLLEASNELLNGIDSGIGLNNLLTGIQTYQLYKINKNTKILGS